MSVVSDLLRGFHSILSNLCLFLFAHFFFFILNRAIIYSYFLILYFLSSLLFSVCNACSLQVTKIASCQGRNPEERK